MIYQLLFFRDHPLSFPHIQNLKTPQEVIITLKHILELQIKHKKSRRRWGTRKERNQLESSQEQCFQIFRASRPHLIIEMST